METTEKKIVKGGDFLIRETAYQDVFIPEEFDEEQQMIAQTCRDFLSSEVYPNLDRIDQQEEGLMESLMTKAGELGLLGVSIPEEYGGFGKNFNTSMLVTDIIGAGHSFAANTLLRQRRTETKIHSKTWNGRMESFLLLNRT
jgi:alkylation response protein AidB-like acyl-CoA dehydrogenase